MGSPTEELAEKGCCLPAERPSVAQSHTNTGDGVDACLATERYALSKWQMEAQVRKNALAQKNTLQTRAKNVQEHLSFGTLEANERYPGETGDKGLGVCSYHIYLRL